MAYNNIMNISLEDFQPILDRYLNSIPIQTLGLQLLLDCIQLFLKALQFRAANKF